jgi:hypothetical protein
VRTNNNLMYFLRRPAAGHGLQRPLRRQRADPRLRARLLHRRRAEELVRRHLPHLGPADDSEGKWGLNFRVHLRQGQADRHDNPGEGVSFGAFDYINSSALFKIPGTNDERHRLVASGTYRLPANFQVSSLITLGSGVPFTVFDNSHDPFTVRWNEGRADKKDFIIPNAWVYRSVDLRLEWQAPAIHDVAVTLLAEGFNIFDFDNFSNFDADVPRLPNVNPHFGRAAHRVQHPPLPGRRAS